MKREKIVITLDLDDELCFDGVIEKIIEDVLREKQDSRGYIIRDVSVKIDETGETWLVKGDHPILPRPDKFFRNPNAKMKAEAFACELAELGYENVIGEIVNIKEFINVK